MRRVTVSKTYKLFVGGAFARSESGRSYAPAGAPRVNVARASRKDLRDAVVAARKALPGWHGASAYLRGQVLYRLAEILESRADALAGELRACTGQGAAAARREVARTIELVVWHAGLTDKLWSLLGSQNQVSGPFFNFSTVEPTGVIGLLAPPAPALYGLAAMLLPLLAGANTVVAVASEPAPLPAIALGEALATSDLPAGVVNLLTGLRAELAPELASHRDVDGLLAGGAPDPALGRAAAGAVKRVRFASLAAPDWRRHEPSLAWVEPFVEIKTLWHPVAP
jgi:acyl-CoA reductase-like NAD-dependent aldehyde dehydrogenase